MWSYLGFVNIPHALALALHHARNSGARVSAPGALRRAARFAIHFVRFVLEDDNFETARFLF
jgi:hypothetical protein